MRRFAGGQDDGTKPFDPDKDFQMISVQITGSTWDNLVHDDQTFGGYTRLGKFAQVSPNTNRVVIRLIANVEEESQ